MSFFDEEGEDPFADIMQEFFGQRPTRRRQTNGIITGEQEERVIDFVESDKKIYLVFELPGYSKEDVEVNINRGNIEIIVKKRNISDVQSYLTNKLLQGINFRKTLPKFVNTKKFDYNFKNGILEVVFNRK